MDDDLRPPLPPDRLPALTDDLRVRFGPPRAGWIRITLRAAGLNSTFSASDVFDPFPALRAWLEALTAGAFPTIAIDQEGWLVLLVATPGATADEVRVTLWSDRDDGYSGLAESYRLEDDLRLGRGDLVRAFYEGLRAFWEKPDPRTFWKEWGGYDRPPYEVRSEVIERYLARG